LSRLPVNELKIDKSFVLQMLDRDRDAKIVQSTIDLAHNLGLKVVAEGVENEQIVHRLREIGCDVAQGYYFGKPMAAPQIDQLQTRLGDNRIIRPRVVAARH
jgi:EAL domain-containing protein (putative c-di-GMP-specific phosphodiesterase class I)